MSKNNAVRKSKYDPQLTPSERIELLKFLGEYHSNSEAKRFMAANFGKQMAMSSIQWYRGAKCPYKPLLERFRRDFDKLLLPIDSKEVQLDRLADYRMIWKDGKPYVVSKIEAVRKPSDAKARAGNQSPERSQNNSKSWSFLKLASWDWT